MQPRCKETRKQSDENLQRYLSTKKECLPNVFGNISIQGQISSNAIFTYFTVFSSSGSYAGHPFNDEYIFNEPTLMEMIGDQGKIAIIISVI